MRVLSPLLFEDVLALLRQRGEVSDLVLPLLLALDVALGPRLALLALLRQRVCHPLAGRRLDVVVVNLDEVDLLAGSLLAKSGLADEPLKCVGVGKEVVVRTGRRHRLWRRVRRDGGSEDVGVGDNAVVVVALVVVVGDGRRSNRGKTGFERFGLDDTVRNLLL